MTSTLLARVRVPASARVRVLASVLALGLALAAAVGLPGCISYRLDELPPAPPLPEPAITDQRPSLLFTVTAVMGADLADSGNTFPEMDLTTPADEMSAMLQRSGYFRSVQPAAEDRTGDVRINAVLSVDGNDVVVLVSMCTLTLIPMWRTVTWELTAEVRGPDGHTHRYTMQDSARDIFWLPIILGMSMRPWGEAYGEVRDNMFRTLLARMHADGLLAPVATPPKGAAPAVPAAPTAPAVPAAPTVPAAPAVPAVPATPPPGGTPPATPDGAG
jgi:hypothetical protein